MLTSSTSHPSNPDSGPISGPSAAGDRAAPELLETGGEQNIRYRGRLLYSERGPVFFAERLAAAAADSEGAGPARLYLLASPCLWHGVATLLRRIEAGSMLLCLEAEPALAALARNKLPPSLAQDPRLRFAPDLDPEALLKLASELGTFRRAVLVRISGGAAFHEESYRRVAARLDAEFIATWKNRGSLMALGRLWVRNTFANLASLDEIAPLPLPRLSLPILVCGAGPSLETALPLLERRRERIFLLACDTALPPLLAAGFLPDLVVCLEAQAHNLADFVPLGDRGLSLLADLSSHPASFRVVKGTKHLSLVRIDEGAFSKRLQAIGLPALVVPPLGSVGVHALYIARRLAAGSVPVLASGLDFAFESGKTHARGSPSLLADERTLTRLQRWPRQVASAFRRGVRSVQDDLPRGQSLPPSSASLGGLSPVLGGQSPTLGGRSPALPPSPLNKPAQLEGQLLTDPVLAGYAALLAEEIAEPGPPVFDIRGRGLGLGAPRLGLEAALSLIDTCQVDASVAAKPAPKTHETRLMGPLGRSFLAGELSRLEALESALKGRLALSSAELLSSIRNLDYLLWPAPDAERIRDLPQDLLNRVLVESEYWIWRLEELLA